MRKQLLEIKWWDWDEEKIKRNKKFFTTDLAGVKNYSQSYPLLLWIIWMTLMHSAFS